MGLSDAVSSSNDGNKMETDDLICSTSNHNNDAIKIRILNKVAKSNAFFKSQQRGEADLTYEEKHKISESLLSTNITLFLQRYHKFLNFEDLSYFEAFSGDYEINYYIGEIRKTSDDKKYKAIVKNRRYEALKKLEAEGSYFSDREMRHRNPFLYEEFIGQYLTDRERSDTMKKETDVTSTFSGFLMDQIDKNYDENHLKMQENQDDIESAMYENDDDINDSDESEYVSDNEELAGPLRRTIQLPPQEKQRLRTEFTNIMYESFLAGKDSNFDYSTVDENAEYDSVQQRGIDEEEKYFDEDSS